jgi:uncharacterized protein (DUF2141 family)
MSINTIVRLCVAAWLALVGGAAHAADVRVSIEGLRSADGKVIVGLYDKAREFPGGKLLDGRIVASAKGAVMVTFKDVPPGRYALSAFHDVNGNGRLDADMSGIPTEPLGASRDARGTAGPPSFDDAAVTVDGEPLALTIHLH